MSLSKSLSVLLEDGILEEVHGRIMIGKEAEVYAVRFQGRTVAAKVYKVREHRSFQNHAAYLEGRSGGRDSRTRRAIAKGSAFGKSVAERGWKEMEHQALQLGFHIGVRVPQPILLYENTLLMEMVVDDEGNPAPRMSDLSFDPDQAVELHKDVFEQVKRLLGAHRIHGDLSPYNILMGTDGPTLIDLPQIIDAASNLGAPRFLERDLRSVVEYLARFAPGLAALAGCGTVLWQHYLRGTLDAAEPMQAPAAPRERAPRAGGPQRLKLRGGREEVILSARRAPRGVARDGRAEARATARTSAPAARPQPARQQPRHPVAKQALATPPAAGEPLAPKQVTRQQAAQQQPQDRPAQPPDRRPQPSSRSAEPHPRRAPQQQRQAPPLDRPAQPRNRHDPHPGRPAQPQNPDRAAPPNDGRRRRRRPRRHGG
jgi:RIO kinase 1